MNRFLHRRAWAGLGAALLLAGCAGLGKTPESSLEQELRRAAGMHDPRPSVAARADQLSVEGGTSGAGETAVPVPGRQSGEDTGSGQARVFRGSDTMVKLPAVAGKPLKGEAVVLRFEQAPIAEVVHAILGDMLKQNYTIHPPLAGEVTLHTLAPLPPEQILTVLESMLQANGLGIAQDATGIYHVGRPDALKAFAPQPRRVGRLPAGNSLLIVPLQYVGAAEMAEILAPVAGPAAFVRVDNFRNLLILAGSRGQLEGWMKIVEIFDVDLLKGMSVGLFPLQNTSVEEVEEALRLVTGNERASAPARTAPGRPEGAAAAVVGGTPLGGAMKILPIERLNAILVVTPRSAYLDIAREWIERFDRPDNDGGPRLYVYPVQNGSAAHLATLLNGIFGGGALNTTRRGARDSGVAPGLASATASDLGATRTMAASTSGTAGSGGASGNGGQISQLSFGDIRVVADDQNNALLIYAPRTEYNKIEAALRQIDVAASQVLIEASIIEVSLTDETRYGLQWFFTDNLRGRGWTGSGRLGLGDGGGIVGQSGFSYSITNPLGEVRAVLNALADKQLLKVISSPSVMVLDNQTAEIKVGDQQPVRNARTVTDGGTTTDSISFKDTGVVLKVTPSVNAGNTILMEIDQSVTDVGQVDAATGQRAFLQRQITSKVAVPSGDTVVLGGLIRDNASRGRQGVPLLADLPVVGALFGTTTINADRTELLVMITPRVVRTERDLNELTEEIQTRMQSVSRFLSEHAAPASTLQRPVAPDRGGAADAAAER